MVSREIFHPLSHEFNISIETVDRILKQQQAEREAAERQRLEQQQKYMQQTEAEQLVSEMSPNTSETTLTSPEVPPKHDSPADTSAEREKRDSKRVSAITNNLWKRMRGSGAQTERAPAITSVSRPTSPDGEIGSVRGGGSGPGVRPKSPQPGVTPMSNIGASNGARKGTKYS